MRTVPPVVSIAPIVAASRADPVNHEQVCGLVGMRVIHLTLRQLHALQANSDRPLDLDMPLGTHPSKNPTPTQGH